MLSDLDKLVKFTEQIKELNELNKKIPEEEGFDDVEITIEPQASINIYWTNKSGKRKDHSTFTFSTIQDLDERLRKRIERRQKKLDTKKGKQEA